MSTSWMLTSVPYTVSTFLLSPLTAVSELLTPTPSWALLGGFLILGNWSEVLQLLQSINKYTLFSTVSVLAVTFGFTRWIHPLSIKPQRKGSHHDVGGLEPMFFPSRTTHTRLFPKIHSFSYSYLLAGIPIGWQGSAGGILSVDVGDSDSFFSNSLFTVHAADYLNRGYGYLGFQGKLRKYLQSQNVNPDNYPFAYLMTVPKFFGYSFNPVSFWYLYNTDRKLSAIILEVNNTFDERRLYLLMQDHIPIASDKAETENNAEKQIDQDISPVHEHAKKPSRFTESFSKDFHLSPFSLRDGSYSLIAYDPSGSQPLVNSTLTLRSPQGRAKVVGRIFSTGRAINPAKMSFLDKITFLVFWWRVGFFAFPRTIKQAFLLHFKRNLHVWSHPEPLKDTISRRATPTEAAIEATFRAYLRHRVSCAEISLILKYTAAGIIDTDEIMSSPCTPADYAGANILEFKVLSPSFYTRIVHYMDGHDGCLDERSEKTLYLSRPVLLHVLFLWRLGNESLVKPYTIVGLIFIAIKNLRERPAWLKSDEVRRPKKGLHAVEQTLDCNSGCRAKEEDTMSGMDAFVLSKGTPKEQIAYGCTVLKLFISDKIAFGAVGILQVEIFLLRCAFAWQMAGKASYLLGLIRRIAGR